MSNVFKKVPDYALVKDKVKEVLENNFIKLPPINIQNLVENYGLKLQYARFKETAYAAFWI